MNLQEFLEQLYRTIDLSIGKNEDWRDIEVVITTADHCFGGRGKTNVKSIHRGIDWEHNQIRIETTDKIRK